MLDTLSPEQGQQNKPTNDERKMPMEAGYQRFSNR
jgi:hypothetical protein